ncbi:hypothetical protein B0I35DRAFT_463864 [Stachybotrys elegans]|uniref:Uncharacterized protein n=1 Tax=Stachybotrys elegans TaxID=80388 RepID=A0A8K0SIE8_9HYPO|nr:hypothetical protein B0I35DRAFT_463864 [Stachybotrys elegans]
MPLIVLRCASAKAFRNRLPDASIALSVSGSMALAPGVAVQASAALWRASLIMAATICIVLTFLARNSTDKFSRFGVPGLVHYWDPTAEPYRRVVKVANVGPWHNQEDVVSHMWNAILSHYFPSTAAPGLPFQWIVGREPSRGPAAPVSERIKVTMSVLAPGPSGTLANDVERDYIWVECKAPSRDEPFEWKGAFDEAARRLDVAYRDREMFVIVAIGLKYIKLYWDGPRKLPLPGCKILGWRADRWALDDRFKAPVGLLRLSPYVNQATGDIDTSRALSLDFWTRGGPDGRPLNHGACTNLELFFQDIRTMIKLPGVNPTQF